MHIIQNLCNSSSRIDDPKQSGIESVRHALLWVCGMSASSVLAGTARTLVVLHGAVVVSQPFKWNPYWVKGDAGPGSALKGGDTQGGLSPNFGYERARVVARGKLRAV
jgi:hypothetical protein